MKAMKSSYAVARARQASQEEGQQGDASCAKYREIMDGEGPYRGEPGRYEPGRDDPSRGEPGHELPVVAVYSELEEVNPLSREELEHARLDGGLSPEVSSCFSEDPAPTPPPRSSIPWTVTAPRAQAADQAQEQPVEGRGRGSPRAPLSLPPGAAPFQPVDLVPGSSGISPLNVHYSRSSVVILEEDEDASSGGYSVVIEAVASDWDGSLVGSSRPGSRLSLRSASFCSAVYSGRSTGTELPANLPERGKGEGASDCTLEAAKTAASQSRSRPQRLPVQVVVIRESPSYRRANGAAVTRPPDDLPEERPVPCLAIRCLCPCRCCLKSPGEGGKSQSPSRSAGRRELVAAFILFAILMGLTLMHLHEILQHQNQNQNQAAAATACDNHEDDVGCSL